MKTTESIADREIVQTRLLRRCAPAPRSSSSEDAESDVEARGGPGSRGRCAVMDQSDP